MSSFLPNPANVPQPALCTLDFGFGSVVIRVFTICLPALSQGNLLLTGDKDQLVMLLDQINTPFVRSNPSVLQGLLRIIPYLSFGELEKMQILVERFKPFCSFDKYVGL